MFEVVAGGIQTTVQDLGRQGGQALGIPPSGAQDPFALRVANLLVGNATGGPFLVREEPGSAGLELLLGGLKLRALTNLAVAVTGAELEVRVDGVSVPQWQVFPIRADQLLSFGMARRGARAYLAVHGGIDVPLYLGSRATHTRGQFGGFEGRPLQRGDQVPVGPAASDASSLVGRHLRPALIPDYIEPTEVRVMAGPEEHIFTDESIATFYATGWRLNPNSDRTGMRFVGPELSFIPGRPRYLIEDAGENASNIVIDPGAPVGTIQVPSGVEPIVLGVDSPTIGGYARIGTVISTDMSKVGQLRPHGSTRFVRVSYEEAVGALREQETLVSEPNVLV